jgi:hypothetical protein
MDETRIVGNLPGMRVEITHRRDPDGQAEHMSIDLTATPSLRAAEGLMGSLPVMMALSRHPLAAWAGLAGALMAPWMALAKANPWLPTLLGGGSPRGK